MTEEVNTNVNTGDGELSTKVGATNSAIGSVPNSAVNNTISIDDLIKVEIKLGQIISAEKLDGSDKLLKLSVDFGEEVPRQVLSGIAKYVTSEEIIGKQFPFVTNLAPRKMMGLESQAMILAASSGDTLALLNPSKDLPNGTKLK